MMSTLGEVCKKTLKSAKASECDGQSLNSSERIQKNDFKSPAPVEQIQKSPTKYSKSPSKLEHIQKSPLIEKVSPFKMVKPSKLSTPKRSDTERYPCFSVTEQDESKLPPTLSPESRAKKMKLDDSLDSTLEYDDVTNILDHIDQGKDFQNNNNDDDENEEKNSKEVFKECDAQVNYSRSDFGSESGSEDATAKLYEDVERLKSELKEKNLQIISLRAGLRMSEEDRLQLREKNQTLEGTVTELREELEYTRTFQDDNKKLTRLVKTAGDLLVSGLLLSCLKNSHLIFNCSNFSSHTKDFVSIIILFTPSV
ncbi:Ras-related protein Rab-44 [Frankliniella fusca]|uniref:Ras-related protein Rab-44 n=1 Tax=Frankliniella fusca TaxID=407009 RepID=A0AAE1LE81_9NEOP|nr:Ras-related protein Rab-44 [Frankliniella fusca]